jgi:hypothetical protein
MLPAIIGFSLLVIDMSRANNLQNDLQKAADAYSLAGAAELDGLPGSWARSERAMAMLIHNESNFSTSGRFTLSSGQPGGTARCNSAGNISWCFLKLIPPLDGTQITTANQASYLASADPVAGEAETQFIQVKVTPTGFDTLFPVSFLPGGADNSWTIGAVATAKFSSGVCEYTPVFMCNPYEDTTDTGGVTLEQAASTRQYRRRQIKLRGDDSYFPGNFAFLASPFGNGANELEKMLADSKPQNCYAADGVDTEPGQNTGPVERGINSRFGIDASNYSDGPATNVRKGAKNWDKWVKSNKVDYETDPLKGIGLERDSCQFAGAGPCSMMGQRMGTGDWKFGRYWQTNHPGRAVPPALSGTGIDTPTRYETYRYEIDNNIVGDAALGNGEKGTPVANAGTPISRPDRRLLYGAILDCKALAAAGYNLKGRLTGIPVRRFASFFITEPIRDGKDIFVELVDITGKGGSGSLDNFLRDEAQLYR